ncbi:hypothetical protein D3C87_1548330 [compost metagenome]
MHDLVHIPPATDEFSFVRTNRLGNIVVDVAIAQMAEGADAGAGNGGKNGLFRRCHEFRYLRHRNGNVVFDRAAFRLLRIRHAFAHMPERLTLRFR